MNHPWMSEEIEWMNDLKLIEDMNMKESCVWIWRIYNDKPWNNKINHSMFISNVEINEKNMNWIELNWIELNWMWSIFMLNWNWWKLIDDWELNEIKLTVSMCPWSWNFIIPLEISQINKLLSSSHEATSFPSNEYSQ